MYQPPGMNERRVNRMKSRRGYLPDEEGPWFWSDISFFSVVVDVSWTGDGVNV